LEDHLLTLKNTIDDQSDLIELCCDRVLKTEELFKPNAYYGNDFVLKKYSSISNNKSLKIVIPHGVYLTGSFVWVEEKNAIIPCLYYHSRNRYEIYNNKTNKILLPAASPFVYLTELLKDQPKPEREGSIFFPSHSTHHVVSETDFENLAAAIEQLDDKYKPVSVCMYWRDYNLGHHEIFQKKGFRIVSAGHMFDPCFLFRLYHLCSIHKYSISNELGSHLFYSLKSGCSFFFCNYEQTTYKATVGILERDAPIPDREIVKSLLGLFSKPTDKPTDEQLHVADDLMGVEYLKSPDELREELDFADRLDVFGFSRHPVSKKIYYRIPNFIPRKFVRNVKASFRSKI
jgi:hypothetical protein